MIANSSSSLDVTKEDIMCIHIMIISFAEDARSKSDLIFRLMNIDLIQSMLNHTITIILVKIATSKVRNKDNIQDLKSHSGYSSYMIKNA